MGLIYDALDSTLLINALKSNIDQSYQITVQLEKGSKYLIMVLDTRDLKGAAYTAGRGLFSEVILPAIKAVYRAIEDLQGDKNSYLSAENLVIEYGHLDEDDIKTQIAAKQAQLAMLQDQLDALSRSDSDFDCSALISSIDGVEAQIKRLEKKLQALYDFESQTSPLFKDSLTSFQLAMQGVKSLSQITVDSAGNYSTTGINMGWLKSLENQSLSSATINYSKLMKKLADSEFTGEDKQNYDAAVRASLTDLEQMGWSEKGLEQYIKTLNTINSNTHAAGDLPSADVFIQNAEASELLLICPSLATVSKFQEKSGGKTSTYYFVNGKPSYLFTQLASYIPNFNVTKKATAEQAVQIADIKEDEVVAPGENGFVAAVEDVLAISDVEKTGTIAEITAGTGVSSTELLGRITDSPEFISALEDKTFTGTTNKVYNFVSDTKGIQAAQADFDKMNLSNIKTYNAGTSEERIVGDLPNGDTVDIHPSSSIDKNPPALEIVDHNSNARIKIRY